MNGNITLAVAFAAGLVSFASPCCLPLVPVYVGFIVGSDADRVRPARSAAFRQSLAFVLGFTVVFVALWASIGLVGYALRDHVSLLRQLGGAVLVVMGLHVAGLISLPVLGRQAGAGANMGRLLQRRPDGTVIEQAPRVGRSVLFGVVFAAGWTPCIGPILSGIIGLASLRSDVGQGTVLLLAYALGLGIPFILVALGADSLRQRLGWFARHDAAVSVVTGSMLVIVGFLMMTNLLMRLSQFFPTIPV
jgi:cytochrome c-type biogenesis protein